ncbi:hypothetical protein [Planomonospora venezuelensis]|uniref:Integral membrane protein n=1 Tax=Planomonospora venezuelensis TaxID=1999 RepID=A0A841D068_PLAVE|nr:hypothetical protein [Planomonospora venezuelensis]MBB5961657.1 hypothetical protein [Planomonospora venezuelensis]GIM98803.1 membrane protein [Planomonospora venezuelensis]
MIESSRPRAGRTAGRLAPAVWAVLVAAAFAAGAVLHGLGVLAIDHLPPLHGHFRVPPITLLPAAAFAAVAVTLLPSLVMRQGFGQALAVAYGCALVWTVLLAVSADGLAEPFTHPEEYPAVLPAVGGDPLGWLAGFTGRLPEYPTHVRGHPPLPVLVVWALAAAGLPGPLPAALLAVATGCSASVAIALTVRRLAGEEAARRALPYLALTPASVWIATSMDAFFAGVGAWGVALLVLGRSGAARAACAGAGGVLLGALPYLSYGLVPYLLIPVAAAAVVRPPRAAVLAVLAGAAAVTAAFAAGGFLWPAGVLATHAEWAADPGAARPYLYFLVANLAVLALLTGPAAATGLARLASRTAPSRTAPSRTAPEGPAAPGRAAARGVGAVVAAALVAVLALDASGVTRGEVERIWVPYALWIGPAASLAGGRRPLAAQAVTGLLLQGLVVSPW